MSDPSKQNKVTRREAIDAAKVAVRRAIEEQFSFKNQKARLGFSDPDITYLRPGELEPKAPHHLGRFAFLTNRATVKFSNAIRYRADRQGNAAPTLPIRDQAA